MSEGPNEEPRVREIAKADRAAWEPLWQGYLSFYQTSVPAEVTDRTWARLLDPVEPMYGLAAEIRGAVVGIVHFLYHRSTWTIGDYCYLQDLFTAPMARNRGIGRALIEAVCARARAAGASRVYWLTQAGNTTARALYDQVAVDSGFIQYRKASL